jgi:hypothetical protein
MSSNDITNVMLEYNIEKIKHIIIKKVIHKIYEYGCVIYGGFVRDYIIADYYTSLYDKKFKNSKNYDKNFWNKQFDLETLHRTLISKDINICVYNIDVIEKMLNEMNELITNDFGKINVHYNTINNFCMDDNNSGSLLYKYIIIVGYIPYITMGTAIDIQLNIVLCKNILNKPPFKKLDFLCNAFLMTREGIHISNNTGIEKLDNLSIIDRKAVECKIINDIVNFRTDYCINFSNINTANLNIVNITNYACLRIEKMVNRSCKWQINNLPIVIHHPNKHSKSRRICNICLQFIKKTTYIASIYALDSNKNLCYFTHKDCFFQYIYKQIDSKLNSLQEDVYSRENKEEFYLKCPTRNILDFNIKNSSEIIEKYL